MVKILIVDLNSQIAFALLLSGTITRKQFEMVYSVEEQQHASL